MSTAVIGKLAEDFFNANWVTTPIQWGNAPPPKDAQEYVRFTVVFGSDQTSINCVRHTGMLIINIFTQLNQTEDRARTLTDLVAGILPKTIHSTDGLRTLYLQPATYSSSPNSGGYFQRNISLPFFADDRS